jgi:hypothetical protein
MNLKRVCVYCASSTKIPAVYMESASELGKIFAMHNITTIYGGGSVGSMGALADSVLENKGKIVGVIPEFMMNLEWGNPLITELIVVESMNERKMKLIENVDAVVALPGGTGTLEELTEVISMKKLGLFTKPIVIINTLNFYYPLFELFDRMIKDCFIRNEHSKIYSIVKHPQEVIEAIHNAPTWTKTALNLAAM